MSYVGIDHSKVENVLLKTDKTGKNCLNLPFEEINKENLPPVTIVTVTKNRKHLIPLAIDNWKRIYYPYDKLFWLVIDDSDSIESSCVTELKALKDKRIMFYYLAPNGTTIGAKRNLGMELVKTEYVVMMDDDDYLYNESILYRIVCLQMYEKGLIYSDSVGIYHAINENSYVLEQYLDVPEGTMALTKTFWSKSKFGELQQGESNQLVRGREMELLRIPWYFNLIVINHANNVTGMGRSIRFNWKGKMKNKKSTSNPLNLFKELPDSFKGLLKKIVAA